MTQPLCLLSEDMQNRRILEAIAASAGLAIRPAVVSNSFLAVCAHLRNGRLCGIVPHTFCHVFGGGDLAFVALAAPSHSQSIGLVFSAREPQAPMTGALVRSLRRADFEAGFAAFAGPA